MSLGAFFENLAGIIAKLRDPDGGCPWDLEQTHQSLKPYVIEEAYEVLEAIDGPSDKLREELGDLLLQVMLHSQIASDNKEFDISKVIEGLSEKLVRRHPHVFGETKVAGSEEVLKNWEKIKQGEEKKDEGLLAGVPKAMPALLRAHRIGVKVGRVGFDWNNTKEIREKVKEELAEFLSALEKPSSKAEAAEEFGDLLFTLAQLARKMDLSAEECLRLATEKFISRFTKLEELAGGNLEGLDQTKLEALWQKAKKEIT